MLNLKCDGAIHFQPVRWEATKKYLAGKVKKGAVLDIGCANEFGERLAREYGLKYFHTEGDLDFEWGVSFFMPYRNVFCFDVLEHLMNPLSFLVKLRMTIEKDTKVFISHPYRKFDFMWGDTHFHEFRPEAFRTLIESAGYEILDHQVSRMWHKWTFYFKGFRPILRFFVVLFGWSVNNLYTIGRS